MAFYQPLLRVDGRWDYTCTNDVGTFPIGYCSASVYALSFDELCLTLQSHYGDAERWDAERAKHAEGLGNHHTGGHATAEEAVQCFRRYEVLENSRRFEDENRQDHCKLCGEWTQQRVAVGGFKDYALCPACGTTENVLILHGASA